MILLISAVSCIEDVLCLQYYSVLATSFPHLIDLDLSRLSTSIYIISYNFPIVVKAQETRFGMSPKYSRYIGIAS